MLFISLNGQLMLTLKFKVVILLYSDPWREYCLFRVPKFWFRETEGLVMVAFDIAPVSSC